MSQQAVDARSVIIVCLSVLLMAVLRLDINGLNGHMDEYDYLFVGKTLLADGHWPTHTYIFGWDLNWLLLGWGNEHLGGLAGARLIVSLLGIISVVAMYSFVLLLWKNRTIALLAALLLSLEAAHLYSSKLATYDIISFTFFAWSLPALILACRYTPSSWIWTLISAALLVAAVLSKYTALIYLPFIAALVFFHTPQKAFVGILVIGAALAAYVLMHFEQLQVLYDIQINGAHDKNATKSDIVDRVGEQLLILLIMTSLTAVYSLLYARSELIRIVILILMSLPLLFYHLLGQNVISLQKHLLYSSLFLIPVAAWGLLQLLSSTRLPVLKHILVTVAIVTFGVYNYQQLRVMDNSYPKVQAVVPFTKDMQSAETVLSEDPYLFRYLLHGKLAQANISETTWLDHNNDGLHEHRDVQQAVWADKFHYVFLNDQQHGDGNVKLREMLLLRGYHTMLSEPYELSTMSGEIRTGVLSLHARPDSTVSMLKADSPLSLGVKHSTLKQPSSLANAE